MRRKLLAWAVAHKIAIYILLILPIFIAVIYWTISQFIHSLPHISVSRFQLIITLLVELLIAFFLIDINEKYRQRTAAPLGWQLTFAYSFINLFVVFFFRRYYLAFARQGITSAWLAANAGLLILAVFLGIALFSFWKSTKGSVHDEWMNFSFILPVRNPRQKQITIIFLAVCFLVGTGIRLYNLGGFPPYVDAYIHTHDAIQLIKKIPEVWNRAYFTVSIPVYLSYKVFGVNLWSGRIPMVLINMLAIFPLFLLGKKVNRQIGYISVGLYVLSPWIVAVSRNVRDYAVVPLFFYTAALLLFELLDWEGLNGRQYIKKNIYRILAASLILGYTIFDSRSILKIIFGIYAIFGVLVILKVFKQQGFLRRKIVIIGMGLIILVLIFWQSGVLSRYQMTGSMFSSYTDKYWNAITGSGIEQWYWYGQLGYGIVILGGLLALRGIIRKYSREDFVVLGTFLTFSIVLFYLTFLLVNPRVPDRLRYGILLVYWYLPVVAVVIWTLYHWLTKLFKGIPPVVFIILLIIVFTNLQSIWGVISFEGGVMQVTGEKHYIVEPAYELLAKNMTEGDILLSDVIQRYNEIAGEKLHPMEEISYYGYVLREDNSPLTVIKNYSRGWIAVSPNARPGNFGLIEDDFEYAGKSVDYIGLEGEVYLWRWGNPDK